jgi:GNAT superfamily N-acetyltransferase
VRTPPLPSGVPRIAYALIGGLLLLGSGATGAGSRSTSLAGAKELAAIARGQSRLHQAIHRAPEVLSHPGVRALLRAIVAERVPASAVAVLKQVPALRPLVPYGNKGPKLFAVERRVDSSGVPQHLLSRLSGPLLEAGIEVADVKPNAFEKYFTAKWSERFPDKTIWPAPVYRRRTAWDHRRIGGQQRITATLTGAPAWALEDYPGGEDGFRELYLTRGISHLGYIEYRLVSGDALEIHREVYRKFRGLGIPSVLMDKLLEQNPGVKRMPCQLAKANWQAFIAALGRDRFAQARSDKALQGLSAAERRALASEIIEAVKATPAAKLRARHGFGRITRIVVQPHADSWNKVLADFHLGPPAKDAAAELIFVTRGNRWKHTNDGLAVATEAGIRGLSPRPWLAIPK